jgi:hypothetical protein
VVLFIGGLFFCAISLFTSFVFVNRIDHEYSNLLRVFSLFELEALRGITDLKSYLTIGTIPSTQEKLEEMLAAIKARSEGVLDAATDSIISFSVVDYNIDVFNVAAGSMFGHPIEKIRTMQVTELIPLSTLRLAGLKDVIKGIDYTAERDTNDHSQAPHRRLADKRFKNNVRDVNSTQATDKNSEASADTKQEMVALKANGEKFPVSISLSMSDKSTCVVFVRDMQKLKEFQVLVENNEKLLLKMLPKSIVMKTKDSFAKQKIDRFKSFAEAYKSASIIFIDIDHFTKHCEGKSAQEVADFLNTLVTTWDHLAVQFGVEKIKTIGDIYMGVTGCPEAMPEHAVTMVRFAIALIKSVESFNKRTKHDIHVRIGINTGKIVAGVIGRNKVMFDLWGSSVNMASRMQSSGINDMIQVAFLLSCSILIPLSSFRLPRKRLKW